MPQVTRSRWLLPPRAGQVDSGITGRLTSRWKRVTQRAPLALSPARVKTARCKRAKHATNRVVPGERERERVPRENSPRAREIDGGELVSLRGSLERLPSSSSQVKRERERETSDVVTRDTRRWKSTGRMAMPAVNTLTVALIAVDCAIA